MPDSFTPTPPKMRFVIRAPDGQIYGPANIATLVEWTRQNRIGPDTLIAPENSADFRPATAFPELAAFFPEPEPAPPPAYEPPPASGIDAVAAMSGPAAAPSPPGAGYGFPPPPGSYPAQPPPGYPATGGYDAYAGYSRPQETNGLAIAALVVSICGLVTCGPIVGTVGLILGVVAGNQISASGGRQTGGGMATAAVVIGVIGIVLGCLGVAMLAGIR